MLRTCLFHIHNLGFNCKLNAGLVYLHGPSFVSSILYKSAFMDLLLSDKSQYLNLGAILLKALGGGIRVLWAHISSFHSFSEKIRLDISCESSAKQRIHMKLQALFSKLFSKSSLIFFER